MDNMEELKYPTGRFMAPAVITPADIQDWIGELISLPQQLRETVSGLNEDQLETAYRPGGWTIRQVVHHLPDSHMNAYIRFKLALTEENPVIRPYREDLWAGTLEASQGPVNISLDLLGALHERWTGLLRTMSAEQFARTYDHPENHQTYRLDTVLALYAWHGRHHVGQIAAAVSRHKW